MVDAKYSQSRIVRTNLRHTRLHPTVHDFTYNTISYVLDLNNLPQDSLLFRINRSGILSFREEDYLGREKGSLLEKVKEVLSKENLGEYGSSVYLVTNLRLFGYVFNPVTFYFCYSDSNVLGALLAEVNNTFGEKHLYVTKVSENKGSYFSETNKEFYVSPFYDVKGSYEFRFKDIKDDLDVAIDLIKENQKQICTRVNTKQSYPFIDKYLAYMIVRFSLDSILTFPRICWQAILLKYQRGLTVHPKPIPQSNMTIRTKEPSLIERFAMSRIFSLLKKIKHGSLKIVLPSGEEKLFGQDIGSQEGIIIVRSYSAFVRTLRSGDIGFGDAYVEGSWETPDLGAVLKVLTMNLEDVDDRHLIWSWLGRIFNISKHFFSFNSIKNSPSNIQKHYDLSNDLFGAFLDHSMTYSCAIFNNEDTTLEEAQMTKIRQLISKADLKPSDKVLEIGCGWGSFAITAAKEIGCHVTAITLSERQKEFAERRVRESGLESLVSIELMDYRKLSGKFDKIISIEMIEAVGHRYFGSFFEICDRLLNPGGRVVIQAITIPDHRYTGYRLGCDWIQKYIFPGGLCPSLSALRSAMTKHSNLVPKKVENIGLHYATTLREWRERFLNSFDSLKPHGFDERFKRLWTYYLTYCEAGFSCSALDTHHLVLERPLEN